jgi:hypothetical protein
MLILGAILSTLAALLHVGCIIFGASWYRFFGAGEEMARMAEAGSWRPTIVTLCITTVLVLWALYALSGAEVIRRLPMLRPALCVITGIYVLRGLAAIPVALIVPAQRTPFLWWSSLICLGFGIVHLIGLRAAWPRL